jgi:hypothetical protein
MGTLEHKVNRAGWGDGPWDGEPDRVEWRHESGLPCLIVRNFTGAWCGYVGVGREHPDYERPYKHIDVDVHGGLTYSDRCQGQGQICHEAGPGEPDEMWWVGFDCAHVFDLVPGMEAIERTLAPHIPWAELEAVYRDVAYVRAEVERLADQMAARRDALHRRLARARGAS